MSKKPSEQLVETIDNLVRTLQPPWLTREQEAALFSKIGLLLDLQEERIEELEMQVGSLRSILKEKTNEL